MSDSVLRHNVMKLGTGIWSQNGKFCCMLVTKLPRYHSNGLCPANFIAIFVTTSLPKHQICKEKKMEKTLRCRTTIWHLACPSTCRMIKKCIKKSKGVGIAVAMGHHTMGYGKFFSTSLEGQTSRFIMLVDSIWSFDYV